MRLPRKYKKKCIKEAKKIGYLPICGPFTQTIVSKKIWDLTRYYNHGSNFRIQK